MKKINWSFYVVLLLCIQVILGDSLIYFLKLNYLVSNILALIINVLINFLFIKIKFIKIEANFCVFDFIGGIFILVLMISSILLPDGFWDTYSYHIYLQQNPFADKINFDYFPGRTLTSYVFPLADRIYYLFRAVLGYRLGTIIGYFLLIVMFYQTKKFLKYFLKEKIKDSYLSILSILPIITFAVLEQIGSYYIDNFSAIFFIEIFFIAICESKDIIKEKPRLYYLFFIAGLIVSIKVANAAYVVVPFILLIIRNFKDLKNLKWYQYVLLIGTLMLPLLPYVIYNVIQTGSPVYPYYNSIFKSKYFRNENWLDNRYGPKSLKQVLIWPLYIFVYPEKYYEVPTVDCMWYLGFIVTIIYLIYVVFNKIVRKKEIDLDSMLYAFLLLINYFIWAKFVLGYERYGIAIPVLADIFVIIIFLKSIDSKKVLVTFSTALMLGVAVITSYKYYTFYNDNLLKRIRFKDTEGIHSMFNNFKFIFKDRTNETYDIDGIWGVVLDNSAQPVLLNVNDPIVHLEYGDKTTPNDLTEEMYWNLINNNDIYVPISKDRIDPTISTLTINNFKIEKLEKVLNNVDFLQDKNCIYIVKVKYQKEKPNNREIFDNILKESVQE